MRNRAANLRASGAFVTRRFSCQVRSGDSTSYVYAARPLLMHQAQKQLSELSDARLVAECRQGSHEAFGVLVERHQRLVYALVRADVDSEARADDLAQDVFVAAWRE